MPPPRLQAPQEHGGVLALPPLTHAGKLLDANRIRLETSAVEICDLPLNEIRRQARDEAVAASRRFHEALGLPWSQPQPAGLVMTGHQPDLFHPGVWVKNFAIQGLARFHGLTPINFLVDNDVAKAVSIRAPVREGDAAGVARFAFDEVTGPVPYEDLAVRNESRFAQFADEVAGELRAWGIEPLLPQFWSHAMALRSRTQFLGERLAGARHVIEESWGCRNLEVPLSALCRTESFARFACHLLADLPRFQQVYNDALHRYRERHGTRSEHRPVPDLIVQGDRLEAPFWVWRRDQTQRDRLFVRTTGEGTELWQQQSLLMRLPLGSRLATAIEGWLDLERRGIKIRTRALTTTLFARLLLADLFVHGIGGALYDEVTDDILRGFYGIEPPEYLTLSATLHLPVAPSATNDRSPAEIARQVRDLWYNPDRHLHGLEQANGEVAALCQQKRAWIAQQPADREAKWRRFQGIHDINERLRSYLTAERASLERQLEETRQRGEIGRILRDREFAFALYPEAMLRPLCERFLRA